VGAQSVAGAWREVAHHGGIDHKSTGRLPFALHWHGAEGMHFRTKSGRGRIGHVVGHARSMRQCMRSVGHCRVNDTIHKNPFPIEMELPWPK